MQAAAADVPAEELLLHPDMAYGRMEVKRTITHGMTGIGGIGGRDQTVFGPLRQAVETASMGVMYTYKFTGPGRLPPDAPGVVPLPKSNYKPQGPAPGVLQGWTAVAPSPDEA